MGFRKEGLEVAAILFLNKNGISLNEILSLEMDIHHKLNETILRENEKNGHSLSLYDEYAIHRRVLRCLFGNHLLKLEGRDLNELYKNCDLKQSQGKINLLETARYFWKKDNDKYFLDEEKTYPNCSFSLSEDLRNFQNEKISNLYECSFGFVDLLISSSFIKNRRYDLLFQGKLTEYEKYYRENNDALSEIKRSSVEWIKKYRPNEIPPGNDEETLRILERRVIDADFILRIIDRNVNYEKR